MAAEQWDRDDAVAAYLDALQGVRDVAGALTDEEWTRPTDLDGWNVFDNVAHVNAIEDELAGRPVPSPIRDWSRFPHVESPFQQYTEVGVEARRGMAPAEVLAELDSLVAERTRQLAYVPDDPDAELRGPAGMVGPVARVMGTRTLDIWAHEQDIRRATSRGTRMSGPAAMASQARMVSALPLIVARQAEIEPGTTVGWTIDGEPPTEVVVAVDDSGTGQFVASTAPDTSLTLSLEALQLLFCGRAGPDEAGVAVSGDTDVAKRVILALRVTP